MVDRLGLRTDGDDVAAVVVAFEVALAAFERVALDRVVRVVVVVVALAAMVFLGVALDRVVRVVVVVVALAGIVFLAVAFLVAALLAVAFLVDAVLERVGLVIAHSLALARTLCSAARVWRPVRGVIRGD